MVVFAFTCPYCGPVRVIPMAEIRTRRASPPSHWCPHCGAPVTAAVEHADEAPNTAA
jgi:hypothetical protein